MLSVFKLVSCKPRASRTLALKAFRMQLHSFWYEEKVSTSFLLKVFIFKFKKLVWPKGGVAMILNNCSTCFKEYVVISGVKSFLAGSATLCQINTVIDITAIPGSVRPDWEFWPEPDCHDLAGTGTGLPS